MEVCLPLAIESAKLVWGLKGASYHASSRADTCSKGCVAVGLEVMLESQLERVIKLAGRSHITTCLKDSPLQHGNVFLYNWRWEDLCGQV